MSIEFKRERFLSAKRQSRNNQNAPQFSEIRIAVPFVAGQNIYNIDLKSGAVKINKPLKDNDKFVVDTVNMGIMVSTNTLPFHAPVLTYPLLKGTGVTASGLLGLDNAHANVIYNGHFSLRTNQDVNYQAFPLSVFLKQPETNPTAQYASDMYGTSFQLPEEVTLSGQEDHEIRVEFPGNASTDIKAEAGGTAYLVFVLYGWTIQGAAK